MNQKALVVISYYDRHPINNLNELISSIMKHPADGDFDISIVVNRTKEEKINLPQEYSCIPVEYRHNVGMNIGAWDHGWRNYQGYRDYLFLQDECYVIRDNWLSGFRTDLENPRVGMVGESLNSAWERPWAELRKMFENSKMPGHYIEGNEANRIDCYLHFLDQHGVAPGRTGKHLRSVVWFFRGAVLEQIDGFLIGRNYGECIGAEIAAAKKVESLGLEVIQARNEEFFYVRHLEYNQDRPGGPYTHNVDYVSYASVRWLFEAEEKELSQLLRLKFQKYFGLKRVRFTK